MMSMRKEVKAVLQSSTVLMMLTIKLMPNTSVKEFIETVRLLKTDSKNPWVFEGRLSLNDNTERNKIVVTISNLSRADMGQYGCGVEITGRDLFTVVHLTVTKRTGHISTGYSFYYNLNYLHFGF